MLRATETETIEWMTDYMREEGGFVSGWNADADLAWARYREDAEAVELIEHTMKRARLMQSVRLARSMPPWRRTTRARQRCLRTMERAGLVTSTWEGMPTMASGGGTRTKVWWLPKADR